MRKMRVVEMTRLDARVQYIANHMRSEDAREVSTATGLEPKEALFRSARVSTRLLLVQSERQPGVWTPIALFGVAPSPIPGGGACWFLSVPLLRHEKARIFTDSPAWLAVLGEGYTFLHNLLDARNLSHLQWCLAVGFEIQGVTLLNDHPFIHIYRHV